MSIDEIEEQAYIKACEIESPNSPDFPKLLARIELEMINEHYPELKGEQ